MKHTYTITGMTCNNCVASVTEKLVKIDGVTKVDVNLEKGEAAISMEKHVTLNALKSALPSKYSIAEKTNRSTRAMEHDATATFGKTDNLATEKSKLQQLRPLLLIFFYLFTASFLLNYKNWVVSEFMFDFMGLFYIVFSFFKLLDLKGFPESFSMYDPLAKLVPAYAWVYPFIEVALGLLFLFRFQTKAALIATVVVLGITTVGVTKTLLAKKSIRCACLGTALKLPMTEATFIENVIMLAMAFTMLAM